MENLKEKLKVLYSEEEVQTRIAELAQMIDNDYKGCKELVIICVLKGAMFFTIDLVKKLAIEINDTFTTISKQLKEKV